MSSDANFGDLALAAKKAMEVHANGKEFLLKDVRNVLVAASEQNPADHIIKLVAGVVDKKMSRSSSTALINQKEITDIYNTVSRGSVSTEFRNVLGYLLVDNDNVKQASQHSNYIRSVRQDSERGVIENKDLVDQNLVNNLAAMINNSGQFVPYKRSVAELGTKVVEAEIKSLGFSDISVDLVGGNEDLLVYHVNFKTASGTVPVAIPTEISNDRVLFPSTFVAYGCLEELTSGNLKTFVDKKSLAGDASVPVYKDIIKAIRVLTGKGVVADAVKTQSNLTFTDSTTLDIGERVEKPMNVYFGHGILESDFTQKHEMPAGLAHLSYSFENDVLEAASLFGLDAIRKGKEMVGRELSRYGFKNAQVRFGADSHDAVIYVASIQAPSGKVEVEIPVEMEIYAGGKFRALMPECIVHQEQMFDFNKDSFNKIIASSVAPKTKTSFSSACLYMNLKELKNEMVRNAQANDYVGCENVLAEIKERFSDQDYVNAVSDYHYVLSVKADMEKNQSEHTCSRLIPAGKYSVHPKCGHYNVSLDKVITDGNGDCALKTTIAGESVEDNCSDFCINTSKILLT